MAVAPKGVAQNLVSVFLEMARRACTRLPPCTSCPQTRQPAVPAPQRSARPHGQPPGARYASARRLRALWARVGGKPWRYSQLRSLTPELTHPARSPQWADPRKSGAFYAGLTPTLAGIIPYSVRFWGDPALRRTRLTQCRAGYHVGDVRDAEGAHAARQARLPPLRALKKTYRHMSDSLPIAGVCRLMRTCRPWPRRSLAASRASAGRR